MWHLCCDTSVIIVCRVARYSCHTVNIRCQIWHLKDNSFSWYSDSTNGHALIVNLCLNVNVLALVVYLFFSVLRWTFSVCNWKTIKHKEKFSAAGDGVFAGFLLLAYVGLLHCT